MKGVQGGLAVVALRGPVGRAELYPQKRQSTT
jgi:hypothetical protein